MENPDWDMDKIAPKTGVYSRYISILKQLSQ